MSMSYVGRKDCGCMVAAIVDDPQDRRDVAKQVGEWIRHGLTIEWVDVEVVRRELHRCSHVLTRPPAPLQRKLAL